MLEKYNSDKMKKNITEFLNMMVLGNDVQPFSYNWGIPCLYDNSEQSQKS